MLNQYAAERTPTEAELQAIARAAYEKLEICQDQRSTPHHAELHSATNLASLTIISAWPIMAGTPRSCPKRNVACPKRKGWIRSASRILG